MNFACKIDNIEITTFSNFRWYDTDTSLKKTEMEFISPEKEEWIPKTMDNTLLIDGFDLSSGSWLLTPYS